MADDAGFRRYAECVLSAELYGNAYRLGRHVSAIFRGIDLAGKRVLDVGGGVGLLTLYAASRGAEAICIEPEAAGSSPGVATTFGRLAACLGTGPAARLDAVTFQAFTDPAGFDVIVMANSVNHLDEAACIGLGRDGAARAVYRAIFEKAFALLNRGGWLVLTDCDRSNVFSDLGLRSPLSPSIEWHKHQHPRLWSALLREAGFTPDRHEWMSPNRLGPVGDALLANRIAAYFLLGQFRLAARKH